MTQTLTVKGGRHAAERGRKQRRAATTSQVPLEICRARSNDNTSLRVRPSSKHGDTEQTWALPFSIDSPARESFVLFSHLLDDSL